MTRAARSHGPVILLALLFLALGTVYNLATPVFEAPDEVWHLAYIRYVAQRADLPVQDARQGEELARQEASQPPLYYVLAAPLVRLIDSSDFERVGKLNPHAAPGLPDNDGNKNMVVPAPVSFPWHGTALAVHVVRFFSLLLGLITVFSAYALGRRIWSATRACPAVSGTPVVASDPQRRQESSHATARYMPFLLAALVAFNPQFIFISASVNNDNAMTALASLAVALTVYLATDPPQRPLTYRRVAALGILTGLAALSKLTGVLLLVFVVFALSYITWQRRGTDSAGKRPLRRWLTSIGIVVLLTAVIAGWWYARNWMLYHDVTGLRPMLAWVGERRLSLRDVTAELSGLELSFWAVFGWFNILVDEWIYTVLKLTARLAALGLVVFAAHRIVAIGRNRRLSGAATLPRADVDLRALALTTTWLALVAAGLLRWTATTPGTQGRLIFPAIASIAALLLVGFGALVHGRWQTAILAIPVTALFVLAAVVPFRYITPTYAMPTVMSSSFTPAQPVHLSYGDSEIELVGYDVQSNAVLPGSAVAVTVYLQALRPIENDYSLFIHLWGANMEWLGQRDSYPGRGSLPTSLMTPGVIIEDRYLVSVPLTATAPARVRLEIGFYDYQSGQRLWAIAPDGKRTDVPFVGRLKLAVPVSPDLSERRALFSFDQQANLVSAQTETPPVVQAGSAITVVTTWQATAAMQKDYTIFVQVLNEKDAIVAQLDSQPQAGEYPTSLWDKGEVVSDRRTLALPATLPAGHYRVIAGL